MKRSGASFTLWARVENWIEDNLDHLFETKHPMMFTKYQQQINDKHINNSSCKKKHNPGKPK